MIPSLLGLRWSLWGSKGRTWHPFSLPNPMCFYFRLTGPIYVVFQSCPLLL